MNRDLSLHKSCSIPTAPTGTGLTVYTTAARAKSENRTLDLIRTKDVFYH